MKVNDFISGLKKALNSNTCYVTGGFGCRLKSSGGDWYNKEYGWNKTNANIIAAHTDTNPVTFGFDCVCLIKGVLWGFSANPNLQYGGSKYESNNVPDMTTSKLAASCADLSTDWSKDPEIGELVFYDAQYSHVGVYVGNGNVIEATPAWACGVQLTLLPNRLNPQALPVRTWYAHGHTSYIDYSTQPVLPTTPTTDPMSGMVKELQKQIATLTAKVQTLSDNNIQLKNKVATLESQYNVLKAQNETYKSKLSQISALCK